jgi:putative hydrolases of HD superfamily
VVGLKLIELLSRLNGLKLIPRTGWLFCNVSPVGVEDVAQHSFEVATITVLLAEELRREGKKIDGGRAIEMAIVHDWAEAEVADFPYTALKHLESPDVKKKMENRAMHELLEEILGRERYLALWKEYGEKKTTESRLVHSADYLSMLVQAIKYRERGVHSKELGELWQAVKSDLAPYAEEFKAVGNLVREFDSAFST